MPNRVLSRRYFGNALLAVVKLIKMYKTQETVKKELRELFDIENNMDKGTYELDGKFAISKKQMTRFEVIDLLQDYFNGVGVENGYVEIESFTFIHTVFTVRDGKPS